MVRVIAIYVFVCLLLTGFVLACFNPGYMNSDTMDMFGQAVSHIYVDWHPPFIPFLWSLLRHLYHGPQSMLVFEDLLFFTGSILILRRPGAAPWTTVLLVSVVTLFPPVFAYLGTIGKDSIFACFMIFTIGLLYLYRDTHKISVFCLCLLANFLTFASRQNGIFAVAPILGLLFYEALRSRPRACIQSAGLLFLALLGFAGGTSLLKVAVHAQPRYVYQAIPLYDLAAVSTATHTIRIPPEFLMPTASLESIAAWTSPRWINYLFWSPNPPLRLSYNHDDMRPLINAWLHAIAEHPLLYLEWRWRVMLSLAGFDSYVASTYDAEYVVVPNVGHLRFHRTRLALAEVAFLQTIRNSLFFRLYCYVLLLFVIVGRGIKLKRWPLVIIAGSGLTYFLAYFFISVNSEFRFGCYSVFISVILLVQWLSEHASRLNTKLQWKAARKLDQQIEAIRPTAVQN